MQIRHRLKEINRFKTSQISDRGGTGNIINKPIQDTDIEHVLFLYDEECPIFVQIWDQVEGQCPGALSPYFFS